MRYPAFALLMMIATVVASSPLSLFALSLDAYEPNDTPDIATDLVGGAQQHLGLTIHDGDDVDYFMWKALRNEIVQFDVLFEQNHSLDDLDMVLRDSFFRTVGYSDSLNDNEQVIAEVLGGETYFLRVYGFDGATNKYDLLIKSLDSFPGGGSVPGDGGSGSDGGNQGPNLPPPTPIIDSQLVLNAMDELERSNISNATYRLLNASLTRVLKAVDQGAAQSRLASQLAWALRISQPRGRNRSDGNALTSSIQQVLDAMGPVGLFGRGRTFRAVGPGGMTGDDQTSVGYDANTGEVWVDAPAGTELTSINIDSAVGMFTGNGAQNLGGSFDNDSDNNIFKATFGSSFGSLSFGNVATLGLSREFVADDLSVVGSLAGGGALGDVDLIYVPIPEPPTVALMLLGSLGLLACVGKKAGSVS